MSNKKLKGRVRIGLKQRVSTSVKRKNLYGRMGDLVLELRNDRERRQEKAKIETKIKAIRRKISLLKQ